MWVSGQDAVSVSVRSLASVALAEVGVSVCRSSCIEGDVWPKVWLRELERPRDCAAVALQSGSW